MHTFSTSETRKLLLLFAGISYERYPPKRREGEVRKHYGTSSLNIAEIFFDLQHADNLPVVLELSESEKGMKGLKQFIFDESMLNNPHGPTFCITVDGTDYRQEEKQHPEFNIDTKQFSKKFQHCACKFEIAICIWTSKVVWISGPHRGGKLDKTIFGEGLVHLIPAGKLGIMDRGYQLKDRDLERRISKPRATDSKELHNFKARALSRHETFNGRVKRYASVSGQYFRHGGGADPGRDYYGAVITAIIVILQYDMDNGCQLFDV